MLRLEIQRHIKFDESGPCIRPLADSGHARVMLVCLKAGQSLPDHKSASQVVLYLLQGNGLVGADGVPHEAGPGMLFLLEPGRFHRLHAREDCVFLVVMAPHPARDAYPRDQADRIVNRTVDSV